MDGRNSRVTILALSAILIVSLSGIPPLSQALSASPLTGHESRPMIKVKEGTSSNWSGYVAESSLASPNANYIRAVIGTWKIPSVVCGISNTYSSIWVGIDGYSDGTVEQLGTEQDCSSGIPLYYAWYEMYPNPSHLIPITINAGHTIAASVKYNSTTGKFGLSMHDLTTGKSFFKSILASAQRSSAEWVIEAPYFGGILPLSNFGTAHFSRAQYSDFSAGGGSFHTVDFHGPGTYDSITMEDPNGGTSSPGPLLDTRSSSSFSATYH